MANSTNTTPNTRPGNKRSFLKRYPRRVVYLGIILLLAIASGSVYFIRARQTATAASADSTPPTTTVRQGNLVISASGSGTLVASDEKELAFAIDGQVTGVFVEPGDQVEAGTLLAQIDDQQAQADYDSAKRAYQDLTSAAGIAAAQEQVAQAQSKLMSAKYQLEYLISPDVLYWETEIAKGQQTLKDAKAVAEASPYDQDAQQALTKAKEYLSYAQDMLNDAWELYYDEYVPETFQLAEYPNGNDYYIVPTDLEIKLARTAIDEAQKNVNDSQEYYNVLIGSPIPEDANGEALTQLLQAERDLQDAQTALDGTKIIAPISGTILSVDVSVGNTADTSTAITMADLSQLELDFYMDESDWDLIAVGNQAEIDFDALPDQTFTGQVSQVDAELYQSNNTSAVTGIVQLDSATDQLDLPISSSATIEIIHAQVENAVLLPIEALYESAPREYSVFLFENGTFTQQPVEIGLQDQIYAEVKSGLKAGDVVSSEPTSLN